MEALFTLLGGAVKLQIYRAISDDVWMVFCPRHNWAARRLTWAGAIEAGDIHMRRISHEPSSYLSETKVSELYRSQAPIVFSD